MILYTDHKPILFFHTKEQKNHRDDKFRLILKKIPNLQIIWTEGKNLSFPDLLSRSLATTTQDEHCLRTVEIPDTINLFMTNNQHTQPIQCHYDVSKEYIKTKTPTTTIESPHFPIYLQIKENYVKTQLENHLYLPVLYHELKTKEQPLEQLQQNKTQQFKQKHSLLETILLYNTRMSL